MAAVVDGVRCITDGGLGTVGATIAGGVAAVGGLALLVGVVTPVAGLLVGLGTMGLALAGWPVTPRLLDGLPATIFVLTVAAAIVLLGPGAFSLDSYLFGRREIIIPHDLRPPRS